MNDLGFREFNRANVRRCREVFHEIEEWSPTDWACAAAGEMGEACNLIKKMRRGEDVDLMQLGFELADTVTYIDLLATRLGLDLSTVVRLKFDKVSSRRGSNIKLMPPDSEMEAPHE